jgi:hypothetical protein
MIHDREESADQTVQPPDDYDGRATGESWVRSSSRAGRQGNLDEHRGPTSCDKIEFSFLNAVLVAPAGLPPISILDEAD